MLTACGCEFADAVGVASFVAVIKALSSPGRLDLCFLNGEPTASDGSTLFEDRPSSGGVPAVAVVELADCGVPAEGVSEVYMCGDFLAELSDMGSAECCRLSCGNVSFVHIERFVAVIP